MHIGIGGRSVSGDPTNSETRLLDDLARGGQAARRAFGNMYRRYAPLLRGALWRRDHGMPQHECEDLVQQAFMEFWRDLARYRGECSLPSYLTGIALRLQSNHWRTRSRRRHLEVLSLTPRVCVDDTVDRREVVALIRQGLQDLPRPQRQAMELVYLQGRTAAEAAEIVGCSVRAIEYRCLSGKSLLRDSLDEHLAD
jgi:RNA polymerase sigma-70 factor (ECF subfamily)